MKLPQGGRMRLSWALVCMVAGIAQSAGERVTPVQKVIELLNTMSTKGKEEKHQEEVLFAKFKEFCTLTRAEKERTIAAATDSIKELEAAIVKAEADADKLGDEIAQLDADMAGWTAEKENATAVRKKELGEYRVTHQDYTESISALERALQTLKSASGDVAQAPAAEAALLELQRVGTRLPSSAKHALASFAQVHGADTGAPEANAYEFQSGGVVDLLEKLRLRFIEERRVLEKEEMNRKHASQMLEQSLVDNIAYADTTKQRKVAAKGTRLQDASTAKGDLADTQLRKDTDENYLQDVTIHCQMKSKEFENRQVLRASELEAIHKAIEIISSPAVAAAAETHLPSALLELRHRALVQLESSDSSAGPAQRRAASLLSERASRSGSAFLATVAERVAEDPFAKVRKMIKDLLARLKEEATEEAQHKLWCDKELSTNKLSRDNLGADVERLTAEIDELSALSSKLAQAISDLSDEIAALDVALKKATAERHDESATNAATVADAKEAQAAVTQAIRILQEFYSTASRATDFLQSKQEPPEGATRTWDTPYTGMQGSSTGVLGMLEVIRSDFARLEAQTSSTEDEAQREYDAFVADSEKDKAVKDKTMRHKGFEKERTQRALNDAKKELEHTQDELTAALDYYDKLKPSCINSGLSYEDRVKRRQEEIQSLKEALRILEGEDLSNLP